MGVLAFLAILLCFFLLYIGLPQLCLGFLWRESSVFQKTFYSLAAGSFATIFVVYLLYFLGIYNRLILIVSLILLAGLSQLLGGRARIVALSAFWAKKCILLKNRQFRVKTLLLNARFGLFPPRSQSKHRAFLHNIFRLLTVACIGYGLVVRLYPTVGVSYFGASDLYVHLNWLRDLQDGVLFASGIYPFGFHNLIIAFQTIFPFPLTTVMQLWGGISYLLILLAFVFLIYSLFSSPFARLTAVWVFCVSDIFVYFRYIDFRISQGLPQEYALIFVCPAVIFLFDYLRKNKTIDLVASALCFGLTMLIHFYIAIFLILAYFVAALINLRQVFRKKTFLSLMVTFASVSIAAALPIAVGLVQGIPFEQSIEWAITVAQTAPSDTIANKEYDDHFSSASHQTQSLLQKAVILSQEEVRRHLLPDREIVQTGMAADKDSGYLLPNGQNKYALPLLLSVLAALTLIIRSRAQKGADTKLSLWLLLFCTLLFLLAVFYQLGLLQIIALLRQQILLRLMIIPLFGFVPELIDQTAHLSPKKAVKTLSQTGLTLLVVLLGIDSLCFGHLAVKSVSMQAQYGQTVDVLRSICRAFPMQSFTLVATTHEMPLVRNEGYRYELIRLLQPMEGSGELEKQYIPTEYVFIFVEKNVLPVYRVVDPSHPELLLASRPVSQASADLPFPDDTGIDAGALSEFYYVNLQNRQIVMSKAYRWATEYQLYFPNEMTVYYEDDDIVVYRLKQDPYALNNLSMNYRNQKER